MASSRKSSVRLVAGILFIVIALGLVVAIGFIGWKFMQRLSGDGEASAQVAVPDLIGMERDAAEARLRELKLIPDFERSDFSNEQPLEHVFMQKPTPGSQVRENQKISYWVSLGPASFTIPELKGLQLEAASRKVNEARLRMGRIDKVYAPSLPSGQVISQDPEAGKQFNSAAQINLVVVDNDNTQVVTMPALIGKRLGAAETELNGLNLHLAEVNYVASDTAQSGTVAGQSVSAGSEAPMGTDIRLEIAIPTELKESKNKTFTIKIAIPPGPETQRVKIKVYDELGMQVAYNEEHARGHVVEQTVSVQGDASIEIFVGDMEMPFRKETL